MSQKVLALIKQSVNTEYKWLKKVNLQPNNGNNIIITLMSDNLNPQSGTDYTGDNVNF